MSVYDRLKFAGIDMSWYDKSRKKQGKLGGHIPLHDEACTRLSIYLLKTDGTLWTLDGSEPYAQVRDTEKQCNKPVYLCAHCKGSFENLVAAQEHL